MRVTFLMEQHIGHRTFYQNLRRFVSVDRRIDPRWVEVSYYQENGWIERARAIPIGDAQRGTLRGIQQARSGLLDFPADAAFFNTQVPAVFVLDRLKTLPCVVATDITPLQYDALAGPYGHRPDRGGLLKTIKYRVNRAVFQRAAAVVAWSNWVRGSLVQDYGVAEERIHVIPPGIDLETWSPEEPLPGRRGTPACAPTPTDAPEGRGAPACAPTSPGSAPEYADRPARILFVGGDFTRKGGKVLLEAFGMLDRSQVELHLVTREVVPHIPGMHIYHGMKPNSPELIHLYRQSDLFVLPTLAEAFGIAAIEALACGLPVIASRVGGLEDIVEDGKNGYLVPAGDAQALAQAIQKMIGARSGWQTLRRQARQAAEERFDARKNARRCVSLLLACAEGTHG